MKHRRTKHGQGPNWPEPGNWVADPYPGMPQVCRPDPLPRGPIAAGTVKNVVSYEGLGFCIYSFIQPDRITDKRLARLWQQAREAMRAVVDYLEGVEDIPVIRAIHHKPLVSPRKRRGHRESQESLPITVDTTPFDDGEELEL